MDLVCRLVTVGTVPVLELAGEADLSTVPRLRDALVSLVDDHPATVVGVDVDGLVALDDTALGVVLGVAARARSRGGDVVVVCAGERLRQRLTATRFDRAIRVAATASAAAGPLDA